MLFETFDRIYLLAEGQCIYRGLTTKVVDFLSDLGLVCPNYYNPADYGIQSTDSSTHYPLMAFDIINNHFRLFGRLAVIDVATGKYGYKVDQMVRLIDNGKSDLWNVDGREEKMKSYNATDGVKSITGTSIIPLSSNFYINLLPSSAGFFGWLVGQMSTTTAALMRTRRSQRATLHCSTRKTAFSSSSSRRLLGRSFASSSSGRLFVRSAT